MGDEALIPMRLFRNNVFSRTSLLSLIVGMVMFGGLLMIPQYLQIVKGASPTRSGLEMLPLMLGMMVASITAGQITSRTGRYKLFPVIGTLLMCGTMLLFHFEVQWDTPLPPTMAYMALMGIGLGLTMQTLVLSVQNAVPPQDMGTATASATFFRQLGGTAGTAIFLSVLFSTVGSKITAAIHRAQSHPDFQAALKANPHALSPTAAQSVVTDSSFLKKLDPVLAAPFKQGFADSMHLVFIIVAGVALLAFLLMLTIKEVPLRRLSGAQARAQAEAEAAAATEL
jgi:predicted MFS family arabinose efflux permease